MEISENYDYMIVGQGIGGTLLSWFLKKQNKSFCFIDNNHHHAASNIAAGIINPITGRKYVKSWRIEQFLPIAKLTYSEISDFISTTIGHDKLIYRGLYNIHDENTWETRKTDEVAGQFIVDRPNSEEYDGKINGVFSYGVLKGGMQVQFPIIIKKYREYLRSNGWIKEERFEYDKLKINEESVSYGNIQAGRILFAEGYQAQFNPYFNYLPFEAAKGDVLIIKIEGRPFDNILRHKVFIAPIDDEHYWVGSDYRWKFADDSPDPLKREELIATLDKILNVPYEIVSHIAGIRPCVKGRRPFLGKHPEHPNLAIFNGLGTKGASLGPFWAKHLIAYLEDGIDLDGEVDIKRFVKS
ncbi:MAG: FAD-binding oxidoreductase [Saprospiraceae bacterium]|nr:FAD-binding oxidoreductase [Saprospiraceae bacterium]